LTKKSYLAKIKQGMTFNYKWTNKENGNYAIRRKGNNAGKEIVRTNAKQTANAYFFLFVDENDLESTANLYLIINPILKTITYEYVYRGTEKISLSKYLTKKDIEKVLNNIEEYKNKTIKIETSSSKERERKIKPTYKEFESYLINTYGEFYKKMLNLLKKNITKDNELKEKKREAEKRIKEINRETLKIKNETAELEKTTNAEKEKLEKGVFNILKKEIKDLPYTNNGDLINFPYLLEELYFMAKRDMKRVKGNVIQKRYRERKSGKTKTKKV
jgi:nitrogen regulatory protein PII-like uncharacterized protein